jgi:putative DNA primase/helicase
MAEDTHEPVTPPAHTDQSLAPHHLHMLMHGSGLPPDIIAERGYRTCSGLSELKSLGFTMRPSADVHGLLLPLHGTEGKPATIYLPKQDATVPLMTYRPDTPDVDGAGRSKKYVLPAGVAGRVDVLPRAAPLLGSPAIPLWITEGQKKADALVTHGCTAVALLGVWNWKGKNALGGRTVLADWEYVHLQGRDVRVVFDSDLASNPLVHNALMALVGLLKRKQAHVTVAFLPSEGGEKVGVDDYLLTHSLTNLEALLQAPNAWPERRTTPRVDAQAPWRAFLLTRKNGDPNTNIGNIGLILHHHPHWAGRLWWDSVRSQPMLDASAIDDETVADIAMWLHVQEQLAMTTTHPLNQALVAVCHEQPKDLLQQFLHGLPPWDQTPRLETWLSDVASSGNDAYGQMVSRMLPLSMVARALNPGCLYRYVVILEGPENIGKSRLVHALAGHEWYIDLSMALESKESHMIIQGAWVAEMPELDSLTRTEETRLKAFITMTHDTWIPKYSNFRITSPRRTILVGTTNERSYLKGQTGNTRFLPIRTPHIDLEVFEALREQLFAEALAVYQAHPETWWQTSVEEETQATEERDRRRVTTVYDESLDEWLKSRIPRGGNKHETSWEEIATDFLHILPERWKDISLQKQIAQALRSLGWENVGPQRRKEDGKLIRTWRLSVRAFGLSHVTGL